MHTFFTLIGSCFHSICGYLRPAEYIHFISEYFRFIGECFRFIGGYFSLIGVYFNPTIAYLGWLLGYSFTAATHTWLFLSKLACYAVFLFKVSAKSGITTGASDLGLCR